MMRFIPLIVGRYKRQLLKSTFIYLGAIVVLVLVGFGGKYFINHYSSRLPLYNPISMGQTINVDHAFSSQIYFNNELGKDGGLDPIVKLIDQSQKTLEVAIFSIDSDKILKAINRASDRGVKVKIILDQSRSEKNQRTFAYVSDKIKRIDVGSFDPNNSANTIYMHHKFILVDRGLPSEQMLTGSMDFTSKGELYEQSFFLITPDAELIKQYGKLFDLLVAGNFGTSKFNSADFNPWDAHINYTDSYIDVWFSPGFKKQSVENRMIDLIDNAKHSVKVMMWQFNDEEIARALVKKTKQGIPVTVISDDLVASDGNSTLPALQTDMKESNGKLKIILDTKSKNQIDLTKLRPGFNPFIHHHAMIIDDTILTTGTNNWTYWGFYKNDEDTLITNNAYLVGEYEKTFNYFLQNLQ